MSKKFESLKGKALLAMPKLKDPLFEQSVCYICQHDSEGALGFIINKPAGMREKDLLLDQKLNIDESQFQKPILNGGPVHIERGFVIHNSGDHWRNTMKINKELCVTTSLEVLTSIAKQELRGDYLIILGYASWEPGQLENEILDNDWLISDIEPELIFKTPYSERWQLGLNRLGIPAFMNLVQDEGHA